jgi:hypothetical protein
VQFFFYLHLEDLPGLFNLHTPELGTQAELKSARSSLFTLHPHHAALTLAPREQGEGGSDTGEGMVSATHLTRTLTPAGWVSIPGLYC